MKPNDPQAPDLIAALTAIQEEHGCITPEALRDLSERERVPLYHLHGLATFYPHFRVTAAPPVEIAVCTDLACHLRSADDLLRDASTTIADAHPGAAVHPCSCH